jgi:hypothetical protein
MSKTIAIPRVDGGADQEGTPKDDRLPKVVHAALAVYLLPAFVVVMAVGGLMLVVTKAANAGFVAAETLRQAARRSPIPSLPKRVKAPVADRFGNVGPNLHAHAVNRGPDSSARNEA